MAEGTEYPTADHIAAGAEPADEEETEPVEEIEAPKEGDGSDDSGVPGS